MVLLSVTCTVILVDDGLLRTSTGCTDPSPSLTLYVDRLKLMVGAVSIIYENGKINEERRMILWHERSLKILT